MPRFFLLRPCQGPRASRGQSRRPPGGHLPREVSVFLGKCVFRGWAALAGSSLRLNVSGKKHHPTEQRPQFFFYCFGERLILAGWSQPVQPVPPEALLLIEVVILLSKWSSGGLAELVELAGLAWLAGLAGPND